MHNGNLHFAKKYGLYQRAVDLYLWGWIKDVERKFTFCKKFGLYQRSVDLYLWRWIKMNEWNLHFPKKFGLYQRAVDLYLWRWIKDAEWKFTFRKEVWIIPTCDGFVPMRMNKRGRMEIYISQRSLDHTNVRWICTYEDE